MATSVMIGDLRPSNAHDAHKVQERTVWYLKGSRPGDWTRVDVDGYGVRDGGFAVFMQVTTGLGTSYEKRSLHFIRRVPTFRGLERVLDRFGRLVQANCVTWRTDETAPRCYLDTMTDYRGD